MYEMLCGKPPFGDSNDLNKFEIYNRQVILFSSIFKIEVDLFANPNFAYIYNTKDS